MSDPLNPKRTKSVPLEVTMMKRIGELNADLRNCFTAIRVKEEEKDRLKAEVERLNKENALLKSEVERLKNNVAYLDKQLDEEDDGGDSYNHPHAFGK